MINKYFFTAFLFASLSAVSCLAAFEYNGTFSANRKSGEIQSYYILLNENTDVTFSIKSSAEIHALFFEKGCNRLGLFLVLVYVAGKSTPKRKENRGIPGSRRFLRMHPVLLSEQVQSASPSAGLCFAGADFRKLFGTVG